MRAIRTAHGAPSRNATTTVPTAAPSVVAGLDCRRRGVDVVRPLARFVVRRVRLAAVVRLDDDVRRVVTRATYRQREPTQLASKAAPASPDFSGWNWVALSGPFSTAATNGPPWSAQVTRGATSGESVGVSKTQRRTA